MNTNIFKFLNDEETIQNMRFESLEDLQNAFAPNDSFTDIRVNKILLGETIRDMPNVHPLVTKKFYNRTTKEITRLYFPDAEKQFLKSQGIYLNIDIDCEEARKLLIQSSDFFYDYNKNGIVDDGEYAFKLHVFSSKSSKKLKEAFDCVTPKDNEMLVFIEDNVDDWSRQWVRIKLGEKLKTSIKQSSLYSKSVLNAINRNVTGLSQESLKQLVEKGEIEEKLTITSAFLSGLGYLMLVISAPLKLVGWLVEKIGLGVGYLKLPDKFWDVQNDDYLFNKEKIKDDLTIDISEIDDLEKDLTTGKLKQAFNEVIPKETSQKITDTITQLKTYITNYNNFVAEELKKYNKPEGELLNQQINIGLIAGLYNGAIDFIASTLRFIGKLLEVPFDIANDWQGFLETVDNIFLHIKTIDWAELHAGLKIFFELIMSKLKDEDGELDLVRIAYVIGFAIVFVGTLFIPIAGWIGKIVKLEKLIPQELLAILQEGINGIKVAGKNARQSALRALEQLFELFDKGRKYITDFFTKLADDIVKWFLKNKLKYGIGKQAKFLKSIDEFKALRPKYNNQELINKLWKQKIKTERLFPNRLKKLYNRYIKDYPNLRRGFNQAAFKTKIYKKGKLVDEVEEFSISGDKDKLINFFGDPPSLPSNTINVLDDYSNYEKFVEGAVDFGNRSRKYDSEIKYIFNFLKNHIHKGDRFVIETSNIFKTCGSCQREFVMLEAYIRSLGKQIKIKVRSDTSIKGTFHLKKKLKIK